MGFGVIEPVNGRMETQTLCDWLIAAAGSESYPRLPSLQNIFLARIHKSNATEQDTFNLKCNLRELFTGQANTALRHFIMGTVKDGRMASKIKMSRPYGGGLMRVWGWIPETPDVYKNGWDRNKVVEAIYQHLKTGYTLQVWREMRSPRDKVATNNEDAKAFLRSLLCLKGGQQCSVNLR